MHTSPRTRRTVSPARVGVLAALIAAAAAAPANADCRNVWQPDLSGQTGGSLVLICSGPQSGGGSATPRKPKPVTPTAAQIRALRFVARPAVTATVRSQVAAAFTSDQDPANPAVQTMRAAIAAGETERTIRGWMTARRWAQNDIADVWAATMLHTWAMTRNRTVASVPARVVTSVRMQARTQFALDPRVRGSSDAAQQRWAAQLMSWTSAVTGVEAAARAQGFTELAAAYRAQGVKVFKYPTLVGVNPLVSRWPLIHLDVARAKLSVRGIAP